MPRVRDSQGNEFALYGQALQQALQSGGVELAGDAEYETPAGDLVQVTPDTSTAAAGILGLEAAAPGDLQARQTENYFQGKYGGVGDALLAGAEGAASGATLGLSDVLLEAADTDVSERAQANPNARLAGEIGGAIGSSFLGGAGALGKALPGALVAGKAAKAGKAVGGFGGAALGAGLEGAAFGAGQGLTHAVLNDVPLASEAALAEIGLSAVLGAGIGGVVGAGAHGAGKLSDLMSSNAAARREAVRLSPLHPDSAEGQAALSRIASRTKEASDAADNLINTARKTTVEPPAQGPTLAERVRIDDMDVEFQAARRAYYDRPFEDPSLMRDPDSMLAGIGGEKTWVRAVRKLPDGTYTDMGSAEFTHTADGKLLPTDVGVWVDPAFQRKGVASRMYTMARKVSDDKEILPGLTQTAEGKAFSGAFRGKQAPHGKAVEDARKALQTEINNTIKEATKARKAFQKAIGSEDDVLSERVVKKISAMEPYEAQEVLTKWTNYRKSMDTLASKFPEAAGPYKATTDEALAEIKNFGGLSDAQGLSGADLAKQLGVAVAGSQIGPDIDGPADDILKAILVHKFLKGGAAAVTSRQPSGAVGRLGTAAAGWMGFRGGSQAANAVGVGGLGRFLAGKQARDGVRSVLHGGSGIASSVGKAITRTEEATAKLLKGGSKVGKRSGGSAAAILNAARFAATDPEPQSTDNLQVAFRKRADEIATLASNPLAAQAQANEALSGVRTVHPLLADAMEMKTVEAAQFLYEKMPKDPGSVSTFGKSRWKPDESAIYVWAQYVKAVENPLGVLEDAANGQVTPQGAEVLRKLYPRLYQEAQMRLVQNADQLQKNTTGDQRLKLSILFGVPVDSFYGPAMSKFMQDQWVARSEQNQPMNIKSTNKPEQPTAAQRLLES